MKLWKVKFYPFTILNIAANSTGRMILIHQAHLKIKALTVRKKSLKKCQVQLMFKGAEVKKMIYVLILDFTLMKN